MDRLVKEKHRSKKIRIAIVTSTRADYYLLKPLLEEMHAQKWCRYGLYVTGTHCSKKFGHTITAIKKDGFKIWSSFSNLSENDSCTGITKSFAESVKKFSVAIQKTKPNLVIIFGDRYEMLAASFAALVHKVPIAHISGGDVTMGAMDESFRHSISKMASIHFPSSFASAQRIEQLGENPKMIFNVGSLALDCIKNIQPLTKKELEKSIDFSLQEKNILITLHPETLSAQSAKIQIQSVLNSLKNTKCKNYGLLFTGTNADTDGNIIRQEIFKFLKRRPHAKFIENLGHQKYFSALKHFDLLLGNSSSGVLEAPFFQIPVVNIGDRQKGRPLFSGIISVPFNKDKIQRAIIKSIGSARKKNSVLKNPYGKGNAAKKIITILQRSKPWLSDQQKVFHLYKAKKA